MMNPIAVAMIVFGVMLFLFGLFSVFPRRKVIGIGVLLLGWCVAALPFLAR